MGVAAYNRGTAAIRRGIDVDIRPMEFEVMDRLNSLPKFADAGTPFSEVRIVCGNGGFWLEDPKSGFGWWYKTIDELIKRWRIMIVAYDLREWVCSPLRDIQRVPYVR